MTNWDAHDARESGLSPRAEAALILRMAERRAEAARRHEGGCSCPGCRVRRIDATMRALRKIAADAKQVA